MQPTPQSIHVDAILTNLSVAYKSPLYIGDRVFPSVPVAKQSDKYFTFPKGAWFRDEAGQRGPGAEAPEGGYTVSVDSYVCEEYAFDHRIPREVLENADQPLQPWQTGVNFVTEKVLLKKERLVAAAVMTPGNWSTNDDVAGDWAHGAAANSFIADVLDAKETMRRLIGRYPNRMVMDAKTFKELKQVAAIIDRIKYTGTSGKPADVTLETLAALLELDQILLGAALYSSAKETKGGAEFTPVDIWEVNSTKGAAFLYYAPPAAALETPSAGYIFNWRSTELGQSQIVSQDNFRVVKKWWENKPESWVIRCSERLDAKVVSADCGCLFRDTILT
jgi:hypothetical protein